MADTEDDDRPGREAGGGTWLNVSSDDLNLLVHEVRNPLAPLRNAAEVLRTRCVDARQLQCLDIVTRQIAILSRKLDELTDVISAPPRELCLRMQSVDLADVIDSAVRAVRPAIDDARNHLVVTLPGEPVNLHGDPLRIAQVLQTLLQYVMRQTPQGGSITLQVERRAMQLVIEVGARASALTPEHIERSFARADERADSDRLALAIARDVVKLHGGTIDDGAGRGSQYIVRLPLPVEAARQVPAGTHSNSHPRRIMVIDDHEDTASSLCEVFASGGHSVVAARTGELGLLLAETFRPEAVVIDLGLPGIDGFEVGRRLRDAEATARALLIAVTGFSFKQFRDLSAYAVFRHYLLKPASPDTLLQVIENTLNDADTYVS